MRIRPRCRTAAVFSWAGSRCAPSRSVAATVTDVTGRGSTGQNLVTREALNATVAGEAPEKFVQRSTGLCRMREQRSQISALRVWNFAYFRGVHSSTIYQEIFMKRTAIALVLGSLFLATQAVAAQSVFPEGADGEPTGLPALSTYADRHANDPVRVVGSVFPQGADGEPTGLPALSTYADAHNGDPVKSVASTFPQGSLSYPYIAPVTTFAFTRSDGSVQTAQTAGNSVNN